jgi:hypothetical protein
VIVDQSNPGCPIGREKVQYMAFSCYSMHVKYALPSARRKNKHSQEVTALRVSMHPFLGKPRTSTLPVSSAACCGLPAEPPQLAKIDRGHETSSWSRCCGCSCRFLVGESGLA